MKEYEPSLHVRHETVDFIGPWYWIADDTGAWDGPKMDWEISHKTKWLSQVKDFTVCIQSGGCQGMYPRLLSDHFKEVYTFEPSPVSFHVLTLNCQKPNIHKFNAALGDKAGFTDITCSYPVNVGMNKTEGNGPIPLMTIDQFEFPMVGLIALDVEGFEINVLRGAVETIKRCKPVITAENGSGGEVAELLRSLDYHPVDQSVSDTVWIPAK
jgi:FkbM family methyltransferase